MPSNDIGSMTSSYFWHIAVIRTPETNTCVVWKTPDIRTPRIVGRSRSNFLCNLCDPGGDSGTWPRKLEFSASRLLSDMEQCQLVNRPQFLEDWIWLVGNEWDGL